MGVFWGGSMWAMLCLVCFFIYFLVSLSVSIAQFPSSFLFLFCAYVTGERGTCELASETRLLHVSLASTFRLLFVYSVYICLSCFFLLGYFFYQSDPLLSWCGFLPLFSLRCSCILGERIRVCLFLHLLFFCIFSLWFLVD
jgi:hypothetical protein